MAEYKLDPKEEASLEEFRKALEVVTGRKDIHFHFVFYPTAIGTAVDAVYEFKEILNEDEEYGHSGPQAEYGRLIHTFKKNITDYDLW